MNFTKEYISLCKNKKVQELRPELKPGDWFFPVINGENYPILVVDNEAEGKRGKNEIWLPTGNQLDEEIIKICRKKRGLYEFKYYSKLNLYTAEIMFTAASNFVETSKDNPLIAKISLLIKLLESE